MELRVLAEQVAQSTKHSKLEKTFTLTSNKVPMHRTDEVKTFKKQYFSNLKLQDIQILQMHNEVKDIK